MKGSRWLAGLLVGGCRELREQRGAKPAWYQEKEKESGVRAHYKKPLITVIHDLGRPAGVSRLSVESRSRYSSRRTTVGNGSDDELKRRVARDSAARCRATSATYSLTGSLPKHEAKWSNVEPWLFRVLYFSCCKRTIKLLRIILCSLKLHTQSPRRT